MNKKTIWTIIISLTLVLGLAGAIALVQTGKDTRSSASFATGTLALLPSANSKKVGEEFTVHFKIQGTNAKVNVLQSVVCYDPAKVELVQNKIANLSGFTVDVSQALTVGTKNCWGIVTHNNVGVTGVSIDPVSLTFKAKATGTGQIEILTGGKTLVGGVNPIAGSTDVEVNVGVPTGADYTITAGEETIICTAAGTCPTTCGQAATTVADGTCGTKSCPATVACSPNTKLLNFKVSFPAVTANSKCANNWPVSVIVLSAGTTHVYSNVALTKTSDTNNKKEAIYTGSVPMTGVNLPASDVAVFIKGPQHLQMKYGIDGQSAVYNKSGGEIAVSNDLNDGKVYNFSNYPMLAGDVTGETAGMQDGLVDGRDFNYLKGKLLDTVAEAGYLSGDLDGSCKINGLDVSRLMVSLSEKQAQLY